MGKAVIDLRDSVLDPPSRPVRKYYRNTDDAVTTDWATGRTKNDAVIDDIDYAVETRDYSSKISCHETKLKVREGGVAQESGGVGRDQQREESRVPTHPHP